MPQLIIKTLGEWINIIFVFLWEGILTISCGALKYVWLLTWQPCLNVAKKMYRDFCGSEYNSLLREDDSECLPYPTGGKKSDLGRHQRVKPCKILSWNTHRLATSDTCSTIIGKPYTNSRILLYHSHWITRNCCFDPSSHNCNIQVHSLTQICFSG